MNARILLAFLCLTMAGSGCIIIDRDDDPCCYTPQPDPPRPTPTYPGDVTFFWTFGNIGAGRCADVPDVKSIHISISGETLHNGGVYACNTAGTDGIVLHDFQPRTYSYTLKAVGYDNQVLYQASGNFTVNGDTRVNVNLAPQGGGSSFAYVSWSFEGNTNNSNPTCSQAGVNYVDVRIDNGEWARLACEDGIGEKQIPSPFLAPGNHTIEFVGMNVTHSGATPYYYRSGTLTTQEGSPVSVSYTLRAVGGMSLRMKLFDGSVQKTCAQAGVTGVRINLRDRATSKLVFGEEGDAKPCTDAPIPYKYLPPGDYDVLIKGMSGSQMTYSNLNNPPMLTVKAFVQKTEAEAYTINLQRHY
ncbi:hypothetical protein [Cystobacter ferrugineus]|uniref:Uncharacterized protein n=1 Tax=Cystobacter ferrugineus TaxID=83449 RepID=A0A1L9AZH2_9BACT|nr:hypothetical protein [Cystobacter ferrugineus]OJH35394.1 hypothetical protein BON30_38280 [Cystobacter ferrugineus]